MQWEKFGTENGQGQNSIANKVFYKNSTGSLLFFTDYNPFLLSHLDVLAVLPVQIGPQNAGCWLHERLGHRSCRTAVEHECGGIGG